MGFLLKIVMLGVVVYMIWNTARRWLSILGRFLGPVPPPQRPPAPNPAPSPAPNPAANPASGSSAGYPVPRRAVVEDTRQCPVCSAYVSVSAGTCGRSDCPQP